MSRAVVLLWTGVASLLALCGAHVYGRMAASRQAVARVLPVHQAWLHNVRLLESRCARTNATWAEIETMFRDTVQYDDVAAHKACRRARGAGCAHGTCAREEPASLRFGCLNRGGDRCCDGALKHCSFLGGANNNLDDSS